MEDYIGYRFRVWRLGSKLLKEGYIGFRVQLPQRGLHRGRYVGFNKGMLGV